MPYISSSFNGYSNYQWKYKKIEEMSENSTPISKTYYDMEMYFENIEVKAINFDNLQNGFDTCSSIIESKQFYSYLIKMPSFQKTLCTLKKVDLFSYMHSGINK